MEEKLGFNLDNLTLEQLKEKYRVQIEYTDIINDPYKDTIIHALDNAVSPDDLRILDCLFGHTWNFAEFPARCVSCGKLAK